MTSAWPARGLKLILWAWSQHLLNTFTCMCLPRVWHALCPQVCDLKDSNCDCNEYAAANNSVNATHPRSFAAHADAGMIQNNQPLVPAM